MRGKLKIIIIILFFVLFKPSFAENNFLDLSYLTNEALKNNPEILSSYQSWQAQEKKIVQESRLEDPKFGLDYDQIDMPVYTGEGMLVWKLSQEFPASGKLNLKAKIADKETQIKKIEYENTKRNVITQIKVAYFNYFLINKEIEIQKKHINLSRQFIDISQLQYKLGKTTQNDVLIAQTELSKLKNNLISLEKEQKNIKANINSLIYHPTNEDTLPINNELPQPKSVLSLEEILAKADKNNLILQSAAEEVKLNNLKMALAKKDLSSNYMIEAREGWAQNIYKGMGVMFYVTLPFVYQDKYTSKIKQSELEIKKSESDLNNSKKDIYFKITEEYNNSTAYEEQAKFYKDTIIVQAESTLKSSLANYVTGAVDFNTLISQQRMLLEFELSYFDKLLEYYKSLVEIEKNVNLDLFFETS